MASARECLSVGHRTQKAIDCLTRVVCHTRRWGAPCAAVAFLSSLSLPRPSIYCLCGVLYRCLAASSLWSWASIFDRASLVSPRPSSTLRVAPACPCHCASVDEVAIRRRLKLCVFGRPCALHTGWLGIYSLGARRCLNPEKAFLQRTIRRWSRTSRKRLSIAEPVAWRAFGIGSLGRRSGARDWSQNAPPVRRSCWAPHVRLQSYSGDPPVGVRISARMPHIGRTKGRFPARPCALTGSFWAHHA